MPPGVVLAAPAAESFVEPPEPFQEIGFDELKAARRLAPGMKGSKRPCRRRWASSLKRSAIFSWPASSRTLKAKVHHVSPSKFDSTLTLWYL